MIYDSRRGEVLLLSLGAFTRARLLVSSTLSVLPINRIDDVIECARKQARFNASTRLYWGQREYEAEFMRLVEVSVAQHIVEHGL